MHRGRPTPRPTSPATTGTPRSGSTSAASGSPRSPQFEKPADNPGQTANAGIHTHGDGLIHIHPFVVSEEGNNATLGKFADYGGWTVSSDSIDAWTGPAAKPKQTQWTNGDTCPAGQYKGQKGADRLGGRRQGADRQPE